MDWIKLAYGEHYSKTGNWVKMLLVGRALIDSESVLLRRNIRPEEGSIFCIRNGPFQSSEHLCFNCHVIQRTAFWSGPVVLPRKLEGQSLEPVDLARMIILKLTWCALDSYASGWVLVACCCESGREHRVL